MADVSKIKLGATTYNIKDANALHLSGGTLTGAVTLANNTYNNVGDDAQLGDANQAGKIAIKGKNGNTGIYFAPYSGSTAQTITVNGSGQMDISGTLNVATAIKQNGVAVSLSNHTHSFTPAGTIAVQTAGSTTSITPVTKKTVVTGGSTTDVPNISKKTVVTGASGATAAVANGILTITNGSFSTGDSVTVGTAIKAYTSLTTGDSVTTGTAVTVKTGDAAYKFTGTAGTTGGA